MMQISPAVAETITKMVDLGNDTSSSLAALGAAMLTVVLWALLAFLFGIPTSESHALIAALSGCAVGLRGSAKGINIDEWQKVLGGLFISLFLGFILGFVVCRLIRILFKKSDRRKSESHFKRAEIFSAAAMAFMHGAQDGQKFLGIILLCLFSLKGSQDSASTMIMLVCALTMALGTAVGGKKIIKSVGMDMVKLETHQGFSADLASALSLLFCSLFGLPVSTTHVKTTAIMGAGAAKNPRTIDFNIVKEMLLAWILTFPASAILGFALTKLFLKIFI